MNNKYDKFVSILSLITLAISCYPLFVFPIGLFLKIEPTANLIGYFILFGWTLGLALALVSPFFTRHIKEEKTKRFAINRFSNALGACFFWVIMFFIVLIARGHYR